MIVTELKEKIVELEAEVESLRWKKGIAAEEAEEWKSECLQRFEDIDEYVKEIKELRGELKRVVKAHNVLYLAVAKSANRTEQFRIALHDIQDMPDNWEKDEELNLHFVVDNHVRIAREALQE